MKYSKKQKKIPFSISKRFESRHELKNIKKFHAKASKKHESSSSSSSISDSDSSLSSESERDKIIHTD